MTPERWTQVKEAVAEALARAPGERTAHVAAIGITDPDLGRDVADLLTYHADDTFLEFPAVADHTEPGPDPGAMFGPYRIESLLGSGGMGLVCLAQDRVLDRPVALKFLSAPLQRQEASRRRFLREAKAAAALDHPYICKIYQTGEEDGSPFIAMEYVRGGTLRRRLDSAPLPVTDVLRVAVEVAEALEAAHAAQIVHRDLKPSNIMLTTGGHAKMLDFAPAKRLADARGVDTETSAARTAARTVQGTVAYMSPEQVRGQELDTRSDIFSFGVVLYECLTGTNPFQAGSALETAWQILHRTPPSASRARSDAPRALDPIVDRMLAKAPEDRYQSAHDLRMELVRVSALVDRSQVSGEDPGPPAPSPWLLTRRRILTGLATMAGALIGAGAWWATRTPHSAPGNGTPLSLAVLPFVNVSGDPQNDDYLANGITHAVTTRLQRAGLRVLPWETARRFPAPSDPARAARELGVAVVLTGTFLTKGDRLRVSVSLAGAGADFIPWADQFDESIDDIFRVQTRIAQGVATRLVPGLTGDAAAALAKTESSSPEAYDIYLQGANHLLEGDRQSTEAAFGYFTHALQIDPDLTEAHVGLGAVYLERFWNGWGGGSGNLGLAGKAFQNALQRDLRNMRARRGLNLISWHRGTGEAHLEFARDAARLGDDDIDTLLARGEVFTTDGPEDLAVPLLERVLALDPLNQSAAWHFPTAYHNMERFGDAVKASDNYVQRFGPDPFVDMIAANALERLGHVEAARTRYDQAIKPLMPGPTGTEAAGGYGLAALLGAGNFHNRHGQRARALPLWQRGLELTQATLATDPDSIGMRVYCASFLGVLGDKSGFEREERDAMARAEAARIVPSELRSLASAHANLGNTGRAIELLRYALQRGRIFGRPWLVDPILERDAGFDVLRREYSVAEERRRRLYSPPS